MVTPVLEHLAPDVEALGKDGLLAAQVTSLTLLAALAALRVAGLDGFRLAAPFVLGLAVCGPWGAIVCAYCRTYSSYHERHFTPLLEQLQRWPAVRGSAACARAVLQQPPAVQFWGLVAVAAAVGAAFPCLGPLRALATAASALFLTLRVAQRLVNVVGLRTLAWPFAFGFSLLLWRVSLLLTTHPEQLLTLLWLA